MMLFLMASVSGCRIGEGIPDINGIRERGIRKRANQMYMEGSVRSSDAWILISKVAYFAEQRRAFYVPDAISGEQRRIVYWDRSIMAIICWAEHSNREVILLEKVIENLEEKKSELMDRLANDILDYNRTLNN